MCLWDLVSIPNSTLRGLQLCSQGRQEVTVATEAAIRTTRASSLFIQRGAFAYYPVVERYSRSRAYACHLDL